MYSKVTVKTLFFQPDEEKQTTEKSLLSLPWVINDMNTLTAPLLITTLLQGRYQCLFTNENS